MKVAFQMEQMEDIQLEESHTVFLMQEACRRGFEVFHYHPDTVFINNDGVFASLAPVRVDLGQDEFYELGAYETVDLSTLDIILFRQDPPFDMNYFTNTVALDMLKSRGVFLVNDPHWIRNAPDKLAVFEFKDFMPPTLVTRNEEAVERFFDEHKDVVIKPLYSFHGHGIVRSSSVDDAKAELKKYVEPLVFQPFLPEIFEGNKRVVFLDGEIEWSINSLPSGEEFRIFRGSVDVAYELTDQERAMCEEIGQWLKERGLLFVGIDFIGSYLTEINVGTVGSLSRINKIYDIRSESRVWDVIEQKRGSC